jgi:hypothetical protein
MKYEGRLIELKDTNRLDPNTVICEDCYFFKDKACRLTIRHEDWFKCTKRENLGKVWKPVGLIKEVKQNV